MNSRSVGCPKAPTTSNPAPNRPDNSRIISDGHPEGVSGWAMALPSWNRSQSTACYGERM
jgi:hypothetical protein